MIVVDDHFVAGHLAVGSLGAVSDEVATTCSWWWRLSAAMSGSRSGALSSRFEAMGPAQRQAMARTVASLPRRLVILDLRELIPAMAALAGEHQLNQLAAEAIVVTEVLGASLVVGQDTPKVRETALHRGLPYRVSRV